MPRTIVICWERLRSLLVSFNVELDSQFGRSHLTESGEACAARNSTCLRSKGCSLHRNEIRTDDLCEEVGAKACAGRL